MGGLFGGSNKSSSRSNEIAERTDVAPKDTESTDVVTSRKLKREGGRGQATSILSTKAERGGYGAGDLTPTTSNKLG